MLAVICWKEEKLFLITLSHNISYVVFLWPESKLYTTLLAYVYTFGSQTGRINWLIPTHGSKARVVSTVYTKVKMLLRVGQLATHTHQSSRFDTTAEFPQTTKFSCAIVCGNGIWYLTCIYLQNFICLAALVYWLLYKVRLSVTGKMYGDPTIWQKFGFRPKSQLRTVVTLVLLTVGNLKVQR